MNMQSNNWAEIRAHYARFTPQIMAERSDEWATDAYAWDNGMISMTPIEAWLWAGIRESGCIFYPQYPVGRVFLDFANPKAKVGIECDGAAYHQDKAKDAARDKVLSAMGWKIYRITGSDCCTDFDPETRQPGRAGMFLQCIADNHLVTRSMGKTTSRGMD